MRKLLIGVAAALCACLVLFVVGEIRVQLTPADAQNKVREEILGFRFLLQAGGLEGYFTEVSGLGSENELIEHKVVGPDGVEVVKKIPGRLKWQDISLKRDVTAVTDVWDWRKMVEDGDVAGARKNGSIIMFDQKLNPVAHWDFENAWPSKVTGHASKSDSNSSGVEELTITHEGLKRIK